MGLLAGIAVALKAFAQNGADEGSADWRDEEIEDVPSKMLVSRKGVFVIQPHDESLASWHWFRLDSAIDDFGLDRPSAEACQAEIRSLFGVG
jgi:hypothetical protein